MSLWLEAVSKFGRYRESRGGTPSFLFIPLSFRKGLAQEVALDLSP